MKKTISIIFITLFLVTAVFAASYTPVQRQYEIKYYDLSTQKLVDSYDIEYMLAMDKIQTISPSKVEQISLEYKNNPNKYKGMVVAFNSQRQMIPLWLVEK